MSEDTGEDGDDEDDESSKIFASTPQKRVIEALHTTPWSNLDQAQGGEHNSDGRVDGTSSTAQDQPSLDQEVRQGLEKASKAAEKGDFEALFAQFASLKDKAANLKDDERKAFAEKVSMSFLAALGDDEDD